MAARGRGGQWTVEDTAEGENNRFGVKGVPKRVRVCQGVRCGGVKYDGVRVAGGDTEPVAPATTLE